MAELTTEELGKEIEEILKDADFTKMSSKKVRQMLEAKLKCDLTTTRKDEIDKLVMDFVNSKADSGDEDEDDAGDSDESEPEKKSPKKATKRGAAAKKTPAKKKKVTTEEESASEPEEEGGRRRRKAAPKAKRKGGRGAADDDDKPKKAKKSGKGTGFTRAYNLSPDLASLMGAESLPRHEVVKKIWALIRERNLYDPKNKQYTICDKDLLKVMGVKRFRTFGMLKYLRQHFID